MKVNESRFKFIDGTYVLLSNVKEIDSSGSYLRLTTDDSYWLINLNHVLYYRIPVEDKVF